MADVSSTEQIVREAPLIEAQKLALMQSALAQVNAANAAAAQGNYLNPNYEVAGMSANQLNAIAAGQAGIGAYQPYMLSAAQNLAGAGSLANQAYGTLQGADTRGQFGGARTAMTQAGTPISQLGQAAQLATQGQDLISQGASGLQQAQRMTQGYAQANLEPSQRYMSRAMEAMNVAQPDLRAAQGTLYSGVQQGQQAAAQAERAAQQAGFQQGINQLLAGAGQGQQVVGGARPGMEQGIAALYGAAQQAQRAAALGASPMAAAAQTDYRPGLQQFQMQAPTTQVTSQSFVQPGTAETYMSPYMQAVVDKQTREAIRQADIAATARGARYAQAGAFGGSRQAIENAEAQRNLMTQLGDIQATGLQSSFQQAQQQFNAEQAARQAAQQANVGSQLTVGQQNLAAQLGTQQLGTQAGMQTALANLANRQQAELANQALRGQYGLQEAQYGIQAANLLNQAGIGQIGAAQQLAGLGLQGAGLSQAAGQGILSAAGQQGQLGLSAAQQQAAAGQLSLQGAQQLAAQQAQQTAAQQAAAQYMGQLGQVFGQQALQQAQLGQSAAGQYGQMGGQQAGLAGLYGQLAGQQANIYGQQAGLGMQQAQGIAGLATGESQLAQNLAQGYGALGTQQAQLAQQAAGLGAQQQAMGQQDVNFLYNLGAMQQKQQQAELDAYRQNLLQQNMQPYQQLGFLSDIYKGAPSSQMAISTQQQPSASPFQQIAGLGIAGLSAAAAGAKAGLF